MEMSDLRAGSFGRTLENQYVTPAMPARSQRKDALCGYMTVNNGSKRA